MGRTIRWFHTHLHRERSKEKRPASLLDTEIRSGVHTGTVELGTIARRAGTCSEAAQKKALWQVNVHENRDTEMGNALWVRSVWRVHFRPPRASGYARAILPRICAPAPPCEPRRIALTTSERIRSEAGMCFLANDLNICDFHCFRNPEPVAVPSVQPGIVSTTKLIDLPFDLGIGQSIVIGKHGADRKRHRCTPVGRIHLDTPFAFDFLRFTSDRNHLTSGF